MVSGNLLGMGAPTTKVAHLGMGAQSGCMVELLAARTAAVCRPRHLAMHLSTVDGQPILAGEGRTAYVACKGFLERVLGAMGQETITAHKHLMAEVAGELLVLAVRIDVVHGRSTDIALALDAGGVDAQINYTVPLDAIWIVVADEAVVAFVTDDNLLSGKLTSRGIRQLWTQLCLSVLLDASIG